MRRIAVLIASVAISASMIPVVAESTPSKGSDATRPRSAAVRSQPANAVDNESACRAYAASFYQSVTLRQAASRYANGERTLALLDSVINAFNDLLATKCSG